MIKIEILEDADVIRHDDWCRPLQLVSMSGGHGEGYSFRCQYSGSPENNVKWIKVNQVLGKVWFGKTVQEYHKAVSEYHTFEFVRGNIPDSHILKSGDY